MKKYLSILLGVWFTVGYSQTEFLTTESGAFFITASSNFYVPDLGYDESNYYFANDGNDANDGHSIENRKKTIEELNSLTLSPNDTVFFKKGDTWREELIIPNSGTSGNNIVFTSYGTGDKPKIWGSAFDSTWNNPTGNVWRCGIYIDPFVGFDAQIWFRETDGSITWGDSVVVGMSNLVAEYDWYWNNDSIYVYSTTDPGTAYTTVEIPQRVQCIFLNDKEYLTFYGLELQFGNDGGIIEDYPTDNYTGLTIENCNLSYFGQQDGIGYAIHACYNDMNVLYDTISETGRRGLSLTNYGGADVDISTILVDHCDFSSGYHVVGVNLFAGASGGADGDIDSVVIRNSTFWHEEGSDEDNTNLIEVQGSWNRVGDGIVNGLYIYNNIFKYFQYKAISLVDSVNDVHIVNNTFYKVNNPDRVGGVQIMSIETDLDITITVKNNIFYSNANPAIGDSKDIFMSEETRFQDLDGDYNLHYSTNTGNYIYAKYLGDDYDMTELAYLQSEKSQELNAPDVSDPLIDTDNNYYVREGSSAIDSGIAIDYITTDYYGVTRDDPPNIGAIEGEIDYDATNYYFANAPEGDNANHGNSTYYPKETISAVNGLALTPGDSVFFKKGDLFEGQINNPEDGSGATPVVFTSYGTGERPILTTSFVESETGDWTEESTNKWLNEDANFGGSNYNVGNLYFNDVSIGYNRKSEAAVDDTIGEFFYDTGTDDLLVYCISNPATYWGNIRIAINSVMFNGDAGDNITIDGLAFKWGGRHGVVWNTTAADTIEIRNCDFIKIGGSENYDAAGFQVGNAIEFYSGDYMDIVVENCYFEDIFDASVTSQYPSAGEDLTRWYVHGNVFFNTRYAFELAWGTDGEIHTLHFNNNTCLRNDDYIFSRDNRWSIATEQAGFVTFYNAQNAVNTDVDIYNNIFYYENVTGFASAGVRYNFFPLPAHIDIDYNLYYSPDAFTGDHCLGNASGVEKYTLGTWQAASGTPDVNGYNSDPDFQSMPTNYRPSSGTDAIDGGIAVTEYTTDFEGVAVGSPPNIGAYETVSGAQTLYYVAVDGDDNNNGTIGFPFATWDKLDDVLTAGDTAYIRGGTYTMTGTGNKCYWNNLNGTVDDSIKIYNYSGETPIMTAPTTGAATWRGIKMENSEYVHIKGLKIYEVNQDVSGDLVIGFVMYNNNSNCVIENCVVDSLDGIGFAVQNSTDMLFLNCDASHLKDPYSGSPYGGADGFVIWGDEGNTRTTYKGCRAWFCSDDGFDRFIDTTYTIYDSCWAFWNGYTHDYEHSGDGNGFKLGPAPYNRGDTSDVLVINCIAASNKLSGFNENGGSNQSSHKLFNNFAYATHTGRGFHYGYGSNLSYDTARNNISYVEGLSTLFNGTHQVDDYNNWNGGVTTTDVDFISLDTMFLDDPRQADGSLPVNNFGKIASGSDLIDAGIAIIYPLVIPYYGTAPDMGYDESNYSMHWFWAIWWLIIYVRNRKKFT